MKSASKFFKSLVIDYNKFLKGQLRMAAEQAAGGAGSMGERVVRILADGQGVAEEKGGEVWYEFRAGKWWEELVQG